MTVHVDLRSYIDSRGIPTFVLVDVQQEYTAAPRCLALPNAAAALDRCKVAVAHARKLGLPIAYVKWVGRSPYFNPASSFGDWIEGFEPNSSDMIFERSKPSCYASTQFAKIIDQSGGHFVLAGFAGEAACLSTAVDAFHRGHQMTFLVDASTSHPLHDTTHQETHRVVSQVISLYANVVDTDSWTSSPIRRVMWGPEYGDDFQRPA